eukprot:350835_1
MFPLFVVLYLAWKLIHAQSSSPHILFLAIDDLGYTDLGYKGAEIKTPNLDALVAQGIDLTNYYVMPVCTPTRSMFMTGRYPWRTAMQNPTTMSQGTKCHLPYDQPTMPELLREYGSMNTQMIGKWHLGYASLNDTPIGRGFNGYYGYYGGAQDYYTHIQQGGYDFHRNNNIDYSAAGQYSEDLYFNYFFNFLNENYGKKNNKPLFMYLATQTIHAPIYNQAPPNNSMTQQYEYCYKINDTCRATYCLKISYLDGYIGKLINLYKQLDMWKDTLMVVTTDNGGMVHNFTTHLVPNEFVATCGSNYPLRAGKTTTFQGGVKGVGFVTGGDNVMPSNKRGTKSDNIYHAGDWLPSFMSIIGKNVNIPNNLDGKNVFDSLFDSKIWNRTRIILDVNFDPIQELAVDTLLEAAIINNGWKYIRGNQTVDCYYPALPKPVICLNASETYNITDRYLFNLIDDPNEEHNLILQYPDIADYLATLVVEDSIENGWVYNQVNEVWNYSCPHWHNGTWDHWLEQEPVDDRLFKCSWLD